MVYLFSQFAVDDREFRLTGDGMPVQVEPKVLVVAAGGSFLYLRHDKQVLTEEDTVVLANRQFHG